MDSKQIMTLLQAPFAPDEIEWRVDRGQKTSQGNFVFVLAYVSNRAIQNRLDEVFGPFGWQNEFKEWKGDSQICGISVRYEEGWITKWDGSDNSNMDAVKGGLSNSMKRAAVEWGIGRYLYKLEQHRVPLKDCGQNYANIRVKVDGKEEYIKGYWDEPELPSWALPEGCRKQQRPVGETVNQGGGQVTDKPASEAQIKKIKGTIVAMKMEKEVHGLLMGRYKVDNTSKLTMTQASDFITYLTDLQKKAS